MAVCTHAVAAPKTESRALAQAHNPPPPGGGGSEAKKKLCTPEKTGLPLRAPFVNLNCAPRKSFLILGGLRFARLRYDTNLSTHFDGRRGPEWRGLWQDVERSDAVQRRSARGLGACGSAIPPGLGTGAMQDNPAPLPPAPVRGTCLCVHRGLRRCRPRHPFGPLQSIATAGRGALGPCSLDPPPPPMARPTERRNGPKQNRAAHNALVPPGPPPLFLPNIVPKPISMGGQQRL